MSQPLTYHIIPQALTTAIHQQLYPEEESDNDFLLWDTRKASPRT